MLGGGRNCNTPEEIKSRLNSRMLDIIEFIFFSSRLVSENTMVRMRKLYHVLFYRVVKLGLSSYDKIQVLGL
jgi:hypothetical protein